MEHLLVLKLRSEDYRHAPEFDYLLGWCVEQWRRVFDHVSVSLIDMGVVAALRPDVAGVDAVLLLGEANVLLGERSLRRMVNALQSGAEVVVPRAIEGTDLPDRLPLFTLRDFERAETMYLDDETEHVSDSSLLLPVSLLRSGAFSRACVARSALSLLANTDIAADEAASPVVVEGLYHRFIDYYGVERSDILQFIPKKASKVLEIGCGRGNTARLLEAEIGCQVVGVELNPAVAAEAARHIHRVVQGDIQKLDLEREFDVILALELFEHLTESERFLERARGWLRPGGRIVLSVPNVGHYSIVRDLIAGRWDYLPIGLLCYTHYRFFTRATLEDWLRRCGFEHYEIVAQTSEVPKEVQTALGALPPSFGVDPESLRTTGFYVVVTP